MKYLLLLFLLACVLLCGCSNTTATKITPVPTIAKQEPNSVDTTSGPKPIIEQVDKHVINHVNTTERKIALTFDDGPDAKYTPKILDILKTYGIKATFFVIGEHAQKYPQIIKRISEEGHVIGNHSWDHPDLAKMPSDRVLSEIMETDDMIKSIVTQSPSLFRAPYGVVNDDVSIDAAKTGHRIIGWSVDTLDWDGKNVKQILGAVKKEVKPGAIILQHSAGGKGGNLNNTVEALPQIITHLKQDGYSFVTVPDLIRLDKEK